jgi:hypothetical protein
MVITPLELIPADASAEKPKSDNLSSARPRLVGEPRSGTLAGLNHRRAENRGCISRRRDRVGDWRPIGDVVDELIIRLGRNYARGAVREDRGAGWARDFPTRSSPRCVGPVPAISI